MNSIYIHIPFCVRKCAYCDFFSVPFSEDREDAYVSALCKSIENTDEFTEKINTVYFGGGTPGILSEKSFDKIFSSLEKFNFDINAEITVEVNPGTSAFEKISFLRKYFTRISIGVQSFNDRELKLLGRVHNSLKAKETVLNAYKAGFQNISLDLMYALPYQDGITFEKSVRVAAELPISHISAYELTFEENTPFGKNREKLQKEINEDTDFDKILEDILAEKNIFRYEVSNYARPGYESGHNINYWNNGEYLGFGAGAVGYINGERFKYISDIEKYIESSGTLKEYSEKLDYKERAFESLMLGLRMKKGFPVNRVTDNLNDQEKRKFLRTVETQNKYVVLRDNILAPTDLGMKYLNSIILKLYTWSVK